MPRRTPDQGVQPFERRAGTEEIPRWRGMNRSADPSAIPLNQFQLAVNVRIQPGDLQDRPGLEEVMDTESDACVTAIIETNENSGNPGGQIRGLLCQHLIGYTVDSKDYLFHLGPSTEDPPIAVGGYYPASGRPLIIENATAYSLYAAIWPVCKTRSFYQGPTTNPGGITRALTAGPYGPFFFQGATCVLGLLGGVAPASPVTIFSVTGRDDDSAGALNAIALLSPLSDMLVHSQAIRKEIIGGEIKEVLYLAGKDGSGNPRAWRFDGTTLTEWWAPVGITNPGTFHIFAEGQEILILHNSSAFIDDWATIYYQPYPGAAISPCVIPANLFESVITAPIASDFGGWTGACRYHNKWYVFFDGGEPGTLGVNRTPFGGAIAATAGGAALNFALAFQSGPGVYGDGNSYYNIGNPIVWDDKIVFQASTTLQLSTNGTAVWAPYTGLGTGIGSLCYGTFDGAAWTVPDTPAVNIANEAFTGYYQDATHAWHIAMGNRYVAAINRLDIPPAVLISGLLSPAGIPLTSQVLFEPDAVGYTFDGYPVQFAAQFFGGGEE